VTTLAFLDRMVGADRAETWVADRADEYVAHDLLDPGTARRLVLDQAAAGEPLVLASPGQVWRLASGAVPDEHTPERVIVRARLGEGVLDVYLDFAGIVPGRRAELPAQALDGYRLGSWAWWFDDPATDTADGVR
jgi:hypothetical protein